MSWILVWSYRLREKLRENLHCFWTSKNWWCSHTKSKFLFMFSVAHLLQICTFSHQHNPQKPPPPHNQYILMIHVSLQLHEYEYKKTFFSKILNFINYYDNTFIWEVSSFRRKKMFGCPPYFFFTWEAIFSLTKIKMAIHSLLKGH